MEKYPLCVRNSISYMLFNTYWYGWRRRRVGVFLLCFHLIGRFSKNETKKENKFSIKEASNASICQAINRIQPSLMCVCISAACDICVHACVCGIVFRVSPIRWFLILFIGSSVVFFLVLVTKSKMCSNRAFITIQTNNIFGETLIGSARVPLTFMITSLPGLFGFIFLIKYFDVIGFA